MSDFEKNAWLSFKDVVKNLHENTRASKYTEIVQKLLESYKTLGCNMSIKLHYLHCHLASFSEYLGAVSDEQCEWFHQDLKVMEESYQGRWNVHMMADYCWSIKRFSPQVEHSRKSYKHKFLPQLLAQNYNYSSHILRKNMMVLNKHCSHVCFFRISLYVNIWKCL